MRKYLFPRTIQLLTSYQIICLLSICIQASNRCMTLVNNDGLPVLMCDHARLKTDSQIDPSSYNGQNELILESLDDNERFRQPQFDDSNIPDKRAFVRLGKRGFVRIGKRGFVRIGR
ncbi:unnamed protein product [Heterobilharzia americana]|nr:unnamed protein product [Heterobilharzia americana]